jgi:hypothetical protein
VMKRGHRTVMEHRQGTGNVLAGWQHRLTTRDLRLRLATGRRRGFGHRSRNRRGRRLRHAGRRRLITIRVRRPAGAGFARCSLASNTVGLLVSQQRTLPRGWPAILALTEITGTGIGLRHIQLTAPSRIRAVVAASSAFLPRRWSHLATSPKLPLPCPPGSVHPWACARLRLVRSQYWFGFGYRPGPGTVARQTLR